MFGKKKILEQLEDANIRIGRLQEQINELKNNQTIRLNTIDSSGKLTYYSQNGIKWSKLSGWIPSVVYNSKDFTVAQILDALLKHLGFQAVSPIADPISNIKFEKLDP